VVSVGALRHGYQKKVSCGLRMRRQIACRDGTIMIAAGFAAREPFNRIFQTIQIEDLKPAARASQPVQ